jgi:hypothetical protein
MARRVGAAFLVGMLLLSGAVTAGLVYRCPMDAGVAQKQCCCPPAQTDAETPTLARGCCQAEELRAVAPAPQESSRATIVPAMPTAFIVAPAPIVSIVAVSAAIADAPSTGPPLILRKQSFLI